MFETHIEAESPIPAIFGREDARMFKFFFTRLNHYWLYVVCIPSETMDSEGKNHFFLHDFLDVLGILDNPTAEISELYLVSPSAMNGTDHWKMDLIQKVLLKTDPTDGDGNEILVFETKEGLQLVDLRNSETLEGMCSEVLFEQE